MKISTTASVLTLFLAALVASIPSSRASGASDLNPSANAPAKPCDVAANSVWPMFRHDPCHTGIGPSPGVKKGEVKWMKDFPEPVNTSPALGKVKISDKDFLFVYVGSEDGKLYALDSTDGSVRWMYDTRGRLETEHIDSSPAISPDGQTVYVMNHLGSVFALDSASGKFKWKNGNLGLPAGSSPLVSPDGKVVYVAAGEGFFALDATNQGMELWKVELTDTQSSPALSPDGKTIFIGTGLLGGRGKGNVYALDASNKGATVWKFEVSRPSPSSPALGVAPTTGAVQLVYIGSEDKNIYAIDVVECAKPKTKCVAKWKFLTGNEVNSSPAISPDGKTVYVGSDDLNVIYALNAANGQLMCKGPAGSADVLDSPALSSDGKNIYIATFAATIYSIDAATCKATWSVKPDPVFEYALSSPALDANGILYIGSNRNPQRAVDKIRGRVYAIQ